MKVKSESEVAQSCPTLSDPMDCSPPGSSVHGICQTRVLEWLPLPSPNLNNIQSLFHMISDGQEFGRGLSVLPTSIVAQTVKRVSAMRETWVRFLGREDPLEKEMATHSSTLAWKIPWVKEPGRLQSMGSRRVGHD